MDEGAIHFILDLAEREPLLLISVVVGIPVVLVLLISATVKQIHPVLIWVALAATFFAFSQLFPENRNQRMSLGIGDGVLCAVLTWWWCGRIAPRLRARLRRSGSAG